MDNDGIFEYGYIKSYKDFIVKFADNNKGCIYEKWSTDSHEFDSYEYAKVYMKDYSEIALGNLSEGMILSVASYPGVYFEAIVAGETIKGQIKRVIEADKEFKVVINDKPTPVEEIEWRIVFQETPNDDLTISLL